MSEEIQISKELGQLIAEGKVKIFADPEHEGLILIEVPDHLPLERGLAVREINGKLYYTALAYEAPKNYFEYINDPSLPAFPDTAAAHAFIKETAVHLQLHDLVQLWKNVSVVHESITSLTHIENAKSFSIKWSKRLQNGVDTSDIFIREFNKGIKYPNVATSGLRDFAHLRSVDKHAKNPKAAAEARAIGERHGIPPLTEQDGYGIFTRSICEVLMVAVHGALLRKATQQVIATAIKAGLVDILRDNSCDWRRFSDKWNSENVDRMVDDLEAAMVSDQLRIARFVRAAELFVLALEGWL